MRKINKLIWVILGVFFLVLNMALAVPNPDQYFQIDDGGGQVLRDEITPELGGNNGSIETASYSWEKGGVYNYTGYLLNMNNGTSYINTNFSPSVHGSMTVNFFIKSNKITSVDKLMGADQAAGASPYFAIGGEVTAGYIRADFSDGVTTDGINSTTNISDDNWHMITGIYDDTVKRMLLFIDGVLEKNASLDMSSFAFTEPFYLGAINDHGGNASHTEARFDNYRIWLQRLTQTDVENLYTGAILTNFFNINATNFVTNARILSFNLSMNGTDYQAVNGTVNTSIDVSKGHIFEINISAYKYKNYTYAAYDTSNALTHHFATTRNILNFTAHLQNLSDVLAFTVNVTNENESFEVVTTNGTVWLRVLNQTYNYSVESLNTSITTGGFTGIKYYNNIDELLYEINLLNITFKDETTFNIIDYADVYIDLISDIFTINGTTSTGKIGFSLLKPTNYSISFGSDPLYPSKFYQIEIINQSISSLTLYLLNTSILSDITITVIDQNLEVVPNAEIQIFKYSSEAGGFFTSEVVTTNFEGQAVIHAELNNAWYKFRIIFEEEEKLFTDPTYIFSTTLTFQINTEQIFGVEYETYRDISFTHNFTNSTQQVYFTWLDDSNTVSQACVDIYEVSGTAKSFVNESCLSSSSGTIYLGGVNTSSHSYESRAYVDIGSETNILLSQIFFGERSKIGGNLGLMLYLIVQAAFILIFAFSPIIGLIAFPVPMIGAYMMNIINYSLPVVMSLSVVCWIIALIIGVKRNG